MATKVDTYIVKTDAQTGDLVQVTKVVERQRTALNRLVGVAQKAAKGLQGLARGFSRVRSFATKARAAFSRVGESIRKVGALGGILRNALTGLFGLLGRIPSALGAMREAVEGTSGDGGVAGAMENAAESTSSASSSLNDAADDAVEATKKIEGVFGAFGNVQAGFVQTQGRIFDQVEDTAEAATDAAEAATDAMSDTEDAVEGAGQATSRFGSALDRISSAWDNAKKTILSAIAEALTPALEAFAKLLESPAFQEFVKLLAEDLAEAAEWLGDWLIDTAIPAMQDWLEEVNEAGGLFDWLKKKWEEFVARAIAIMRMLVAIVLGRLILMQRQWKSVWENLKKVAREALEKVKAKVQSIIGDVTTFFANIGPAFRTAFDGLAEYVEAVMRASANVVIGYLNKLIDALNKLINAYNTTAQALHLPQLGTIPSIPTLQQGAIVEAPMLAVVGDNPRSAEVVAPLHELVNIMREALGGGGGTTIHVHVTVGAGASGAQIGSSIADSLVREARARGLRI